MAVVGGAIVGIAGIIVIAFFFRGYLGGLGAVIRMGILNISIGIGVIRNT